MSVVRDGQVLFDKEAVKHAVAEIAGHGSACRSQQTKTSGIT
jgi:hypothetical protein